MNPVPVPTISGHLTASPVKMGMLALTLALTVAPARTLAFANTETEEQRVSRVLQSALEKHGGDVNRCFEKALADTIDVSGRIELEVDRAIPKSMITA